MSLNVDLSFSVDDLAMLPVSEADLEAWVDAAQDALNIHMDKEEERRALWKQYPARDQLSMIKIKTERALHAIDTPALASQAADVVVAEVPDIINYAIFAQRIVQGRI